MNVDKPILSTEMARHWASVRTLVRQVADRLADLTDSEAEDGDYGIVLDTDSSYELANAVKSLLTSLRALFGVEESDECRNKLLEERPELTERLDSFHAEHAGLAQMLAAIDDLWGDEIPISNWIDVERRFRAFLRALMEHEQGEASFIQSAYSLDIGVGD